MDKKVKIECYLDVTKDFRDGYCERCHTDTTPEIRMTFTSTKYDKDGEKYCNSLFSFEVSVCEKCASKVNRNWRNYTD